MNNFKNIFINRLLGKKSADGSMQNNPACNELISTEYDQHTNIENISEDSNITLKTYGVLLINQITRDYMSP